MADEISEAEFLRTYDRNKFPRPSTSVDAVIFSYFDGRLQVLLIQRKNHPYRGSWVFPGGFIDLYEDPKDAAKRELQEETGIAIAELFQFAVFGRPDRDPRDHIISIIYAGVLAAGEQTPQGGDDAAKAAWYAVSRTPPLGFDHKDVLVVALKWLRREAKAPSFATCFFGRRFTGADLVGLYRELYGRKLDGACLLARLGRVCCKRPTMSRPVRINRAKLRPFEAHLGMWWR